MEKSRAGLARDFLPGRRGAWWIYAIDAHIQHVSPPGGLHEKRPNDLNRCIDYSRWTARIRHRNFAFLGSLANASQLKRERRFIRSGRDAQALGPRGRCPRPHRYLAISLKSRSAACPFDPVDLRDRSRPWLIWS